MCMWSVHTLLILTTVITSVTNVPHIGKSSDDTDTGCPHIEREQSSSDGGEKSNASEVKLHIMLQCIVAHGKH